MPAEEIRVSKRCRGSLQDSPFTEHVTRKTRSELIEMGMDRAFVDELPALNETDNDLQAYSRDSVSDESRTNGAQIIDRSMDEIEYCEAYVRGTTTETGLRNFGKSSPLATRFRPVNSGMNQFPLWPYRSVAKRVPHRHVGESRTTSWPIWRRSRRRSRGRCWITST